MLSVRAAAATVALALALALYWLHAVPAVHVPACGASMSFPELLLSLQPAQFCGAVSPPLCAVALGEHEFDRIGSQSLRRLQVIGLALRKGCDYLHTPIRLPRDANATSGDGYSCDTRQCRRVEDMLRLGYGCERAVPPASDLRLPPEVAHRYLARHGTNASWRRRNDWGGAWLLGQPPPSAARPDLRLQGVLALRRRAVGLGLTPWFAHEMGADHVVVAVHVRRGDLVDMRGGITTHGRWVPDEYYELHLPRIAAALWRGGRGRKASFHVFSEGEAAWRALRPLWQQRLLEAGAAGVHFHVDADAALSFAHLVGADVLVQAPSAFSAVASLLSAGVLVAPGAPRLGDGFDLGREHRLPPPPRCSCRAGASGRRQAHNCSLSCDRGRWRAPPTSRTSQRTAAHSDGEAATTQDAPTGRLVCTCAPPVPAKPRGFGSSGAGFACEVEAFLRWKRGAARAAL